MFKKAFSVVLFIAIILAMAIPSFAAPVSIEIFNGKPVVDGVKDELYNYTTTYNIDNFKDGADQGATGKMNALWDGNTLYFYIEVNDTTPFHDNSVADYSLDCIEFFFDLNNLQLEDFNYDDQSYAQIRVDSGTPERITGNNGGDSWVLTDDVLDNVKVVFGKLNGKDYTAGYSCEFSFDTKAFTTLKEGKLIPMDIQIADVSKGDASFRDGQAFLGNSAKELLDTQYNTPTSCGALIVLKGAVPVPAAPAAESEDKVVVDKNPKTSDTTQTAIMFILSAISLFGFCFVKKMLKQK